MKGRKRSLRWAALLLAGPMLAGCTSAPPYEHPELLLPDGWRQTMPAAGEAGLLQAAAGEQPMSYPPAEWWRVFGDPELGQLIAEAQSNNYDLKAATTRVAQAEALARGAAADLYPSIGGSGATGRDGRAGSGLDASYRAGLDAGYEIDFWGKNRAGSDSAAAALEGSRFDYETVALSLTTDVATVYFQHLALADRLESARQQLEIARSILELVLTQAEWGAVSELRVAQQRNTVAAIEATLPSLERQLAEARHALAVLLGQPPEEFDLGPGSLARVEVPQVDPGLPAELLMRRPDLRRAESDLVAANADLHGARAAMFPTIRLTGGSGFASTALTSLFDVGGSFYNLVSGLTAPIFDAGRLEARRDLAEARQDELEQRYQAGVVRAFREVEDALAAAKYLSRTEAAQREALAHARTAYELAEIQYRAGAIDFLTVLDAQRTLFQAEDTLLQTRLARLNAAVALFKALGGGWGEEPPPEPEPALFIDT